MTIQELLAQVKMRSEFDENALNEQRAGANGAINYMTKYENYGEGANWQHSQDAKIIEQLIEVIQMQHEALQAYAEGTAFDFNRTIRGEVNFDHGLSSAVAHETLAATEKLMKYLGEG